MDPSCLSFLRCFLCCQDEVDDSYYVDVDLGNTGTTLSNAGRTIGNLFRKTSSHSPPHTYHVRESNIPTSVPRNDTTSDRSSYAQTSLQNDNRSRRDLEAELLVALLQRSRSQLSSTSRPPQPTSSPKTQTSSSYKVPQSSSASSSSTLGKPAKSAPLYKLPESLIDSPSPSQSDSLSEKKPGILKPALTKLPPQPTSSPKTLTSSSYKVPQSSSVSSSSTPAKFAPLYKSPESLIDSPSPSQSDSSSEKQPRILKPALTKVAHQQGKTNYLLAENDSLPLYLIPDDVKDLIKKDIVPDVLRKPLSPSTYKDFFAALLYAEDYYYEKWSDYKLQNVTLEFQRAAVYKKSDRQKGVNQKEEKDDTIFVAFKLDAIRERRPFLLSRDSAYARPSGSEAEPFQGIIYRVVNSNLVLVKFDDDFHSQHYPSRRYDISFSFNRVCLKRAHQALNSLSDSLFENFLFPSCVSRNSSIPTPVLTSSICRLDAEISLTVRRISSIQSSPPYLIAGSMCASEAKAAAHLREPSRTGVVIQEAVIQTYKTSPHCRILICSPSNSACDVLMRGLKKAIPESHMFRANAAFREKEDVPTDILSSSLYKEECFICPPLKTLCEFKVIFSTFVSCFRLHNEGLPVGHFSHIFMVDASFAIEPEAMVPLANFADKNTVVVVTGEVGSSPHWVRSDIGRRNGLKISYFERLHKCGPYHSLSPSFITQLDSNRDACLL